MALAALIIASLALILSLVSVTVQVTLALVARKQAPVEPKYEPFLEPTPAELERAFAATPNADKDKMTEIFENPDYSGINEEFNV